MMKDLSIDRQQNPEAFANDKWEEEEMDEDEDVDADDNDIVDLSAYIFCRCGKTATDVMQISR